MFAVWVQLGTKLPTGSAKSACAGGPGNYSSAARATDWKAIWRAATRSWRGWDLFCEPNARLGKRLVCGQSDRSRPEGELSELLEQSARWAIWLLSGNIASSLGPVNTFNHFRSLLPRIW